VLKDLNPNQEFEKIIEELAYYIHSRDNGLCQICGQSGTEIHHVVFRSHVGKHKANNLILLCSKCHRDSISGIHGNLGSNIQQLLQKIVKNERTLRNNLV